MDDYLKKLIKQARENYELMTPEEKDLMWKQQLESWMRGMSPCQHGVYDFETCVHCRRNLHE
jgi:hypothetical protein